jgi:hypothetical protein
MRSARRSGDEIDVPTQGEDWFGAKAANSGMTSRSAGGGDAEENRVGDDPEALGRRLTT